MRTETRETLRRRKRSRWWVLLSFFWFGILSGLAVLLIFLTVVFWNISQILPQIGTEQTIGFAESTKIFSDDGQLLAVVFYDQHREYVPIQKIPKVLQEATIAVEDKRFYQHSGLDFRRILGAIWADITHKAPLQGGSTITQQLARNLYLTRRKVLSRKIQEAILAVELERRYSKQEILEFYLNQVYYGSGAYGVQAAAKTYFGKDVSQLNLAESALLAGLPQRPSYYSPYVNKEAARGRRNVVLQLMAEQGYITQEEAERAKKEPIRLAYRRPSGARVRRAPYFIDFILDDLVERYGGELVFKGGLKVYTTLHTRMQMAADKAIKEGLKRIQSSGAHQGALVCIDPYTGYIRAMVGGRDYRESQLNRAYLARHPRQPGSAFKPFVYTAALEAGMSPSTRVLDAPISLSGGPGGKPWRPRNYDKRWHGVVTLEKAVAYSINIPAIKVAQKVGVRKIIEVARRLGIKSDLQPNLSIAIGTSGVTVLEMASAYGTFATGGYHAEPMAIVKILDREGNLLEENRPQIQKVLDPRIAKAMDQMLRAVVLYGTGRTIRDRIPEARGKTGTTQDDRDAWFVGYTPDLCAAVWVGNDDYTPMKKVFGGTICAPIWADFMETALKVNPKGPRLLLAKPPVEGRPSESERLHSPSRERSPIQEPESGGSSESWTVRIRICDDSGMVASPYCPATHLEEFPSGAEPRGVCTLHSTPPSPNPSQPPLPPGRVETSPPSIEASPTPPRPLSRRRYVRVRLCVETGLLANDYCPYTEQKRLPEDEVPKEFCNIHGPRE